MFYHCKPCAYQNPVFLDFAGRTRIEAIWDQTIQTGAAPAAFPYGSEYRKEDIETVKLIYHLVKERGMTLAGARQRMKDNREETLRRFELVEQLKAIREELMNMKLALDTFTYEDVERLKDNIQATENGAGKGH